MEKINISTTQNVLIRHNIASIGERMLATILDFVILLSYFIGISFVAGKIFDGDELIYIIFSIPMMFYTLISELSMHGQTLGKKVLKIKVIKTDGTQATTFNYLTRWLFRLIDIFLINGAVAVVTILINGKGQRFGDIVAKTTVISLKNKSNINKTIYVDIPDTYEQKYEGVNLLSEEDIKTIFEVIKHYQCNISNPQAASIVRQTTNMIEKKTGIINDTNPLQFLKTIIYDYNYSHKI